MTKPKKKFLLRTGDSPAEKPAVRSPPTKKPVPKKPVPKKPAPKKPTTKKPPIKKPAPQKPMEVQAVRRFGAKGHDWVVVPGDPGRASIDVQKTIRVLQHVGGEDHGTLRTEGMRAYGHPELLIEKVPLFLGPLVQAFLNALMDKTLNEGLSLFGDAPLSELGCVFRTDVREYEGMDYLRIIGAPIRCADPNCKGHT